MKTPKQCWIVCDNKIFRAAKWLLSALSVGLTSAFVIMLEIS
jgi:hypothetical protein